MTSSEIRETFLKFFADREHKRIASSSLIPAADPTLLFTNAGMNQFKDYFLGEKKPEKPRATTSQKCVRAGGKHNDLENVGVTARHHTFFEMLGNFSFGDYFKKEAIAFAWELVTEVYKLPKDKLRVTVYQDDDEAYELWKKQGVAEKWIYRCDEKDNFWAMGDTGPCGPCTEIYYDWGEKYGPDENPAESEGRFVEIWNLVFMQYNRDSSGKMDPLPKPSVDTGAGLERLCGALQGKYNNYDTDLFEPIIEKICSVTKKRYNDNQEDDISIRVIADHMRSGTFLLSDGVVPSNEGRGYVLRRILRRAIRHGKKLGKNEPFLYKLVQVVAHKMREVYPELEKNGSLVEDQMREEEEKFHLTLHRGLGELETAIAETKKKKSKALPGEIAFKLYDTFGFPADLTQVICDEHGLSIDQKAFDAAMEKQRSQSSWTGGQTSGATEAITKELAEYKNKPHFIGYLSLDTEGKIDLLFNQEGKKVDKLDAGSLGFAVFDRTPFYAESGGQVGDTGTVTGSGTSADIENTHKIRGHAVHQLQVTRGTLESSKSYKMQVDAQARQFTAINHTATHVLHAALRNRLGDRVKQAGSLVEPSRLRFDFTYPNALSEEDIEAIEDAISAEIRKNDPVSVKEMPYDEAIKSGAVAFFDEKYGSHVRVVRVGEEAPYSVELCGGTHLKSTSEIGLFKIISETSIASGVRRIEALTSRQAELYLRGRSQLVESLGKEFNTPAHHVMEKVKQLVAENKKLTKEKEKLEIQAAQGGGSQGGKLWDKAVEVNGLKIVAENVGKTNAKVLRPLIDQVRDKLQKNALVLLAGQDGPRALLCLGLTKDLVGKFHAGQIVSQVSPKIEGKGGGRPDFAQAGGAKLDGISEALSEFKNWVEANS